MTWQNCQSPSLLDADMQRCRDAWMQAQVCRIESLGVAHCAHEAFLLRAQAKCRKEKSHVGVMARQTCRSS